MVPAQRLLVNRRGRKLDCGTAPTSGKERTMLCRAFFTLGLLLTSATWAAAQPKGDLPKVVLIGDSIRMGYAPLVAKRLEGKAIIISSKANGGDSSNVLKNLEEWTIKEKP